MSEFVPPLFKNLAKSVEDLLFDKKAFSYSNKYTVKSTADGGLNFESSAETENNQDYTGAVKLNFKNADIGKVKAELSTAGKAKASVESTNLGDGVTVKVEVSEKQEGKVDVDYSQDMVAVNAQITASAVAAAVQAGVVVGVDGFAFGGQVDLDAKGGAFLGADVGGQYQQGDLTVTAQTQNHLSDVEVSYLHTVNPDLTVGARFGYNISSSARTFAIGGQYFASPGASVKALAHNNGVVQTYFEHSLASPAVKFGVTQQFNAASKSTLPEKFGLSFVFGDN